MNEFIVQEARAARKQHWIVDSDVAASTRAAQQVTRAWQAAVQSPTILVEHKASPELNEAFDVLELPAVYELKVSGNNTRHEFFKDIFKVFAFNKVSETKIKEFVFLTDAKSAIALGCGLGKVAAELAAEADIQVRVIPVD